MGDFGSNWKPASIGAGGWLTGIDIGPDDTMVVRTDTYGAYLWNGTKWQQLVTASSMPAADATLDHNQGVYEIRVAPSNTSIFYMLYDGYVYRSTDKGTSWARTNFSHVTEDPNDGYRMNGQKMAIDPNNPNVVYVGTPQNGLLVTKDGGASWQSVNIPASAQDSSGQFPGFTGIAFDPTSGVTGGKTNVIYASSYGHGVYESTDAGVTWLARSGGPSDVEFATVSRTGAYYAVGGHDTTLWRFAGGAWTKLLSDTTNGIHTVSIDPFDPAHVLVSAPSGYLNESYDGGSTWSGSNFGTQLVAKDVPWLAGTGNFMCIGGMVFDPLVPHKLWASGGVGVWNTDLPQHFNWATPVVWNSQSAGIEQLVANDIVVAPGGHPVLASWDRPFFYVDDPETYPSSYGLNGQFVAGWSVDYATSQPNFIVGIADWWGVEKSGYSTDGGKNWQVFPSFPDFAGKTIGGTIAASSPTNIIWAPADGFTPYYTKDGGATWTPISLPGVSDWHDFHWAYYLDKTTVTADRVLPNTFYLYYNGVYKTTDGGSNWTKVFSGEISSFSGFNSKIEAVPGEAGHLFFTGGQQSGSNPAPEGFFHSTDGGATWSAVPNVLEVYCFGYGASASPGGPPSVYIVGWVHNIYGIWQSNDEAKSWTQIGDYPSGSLDHIKTISGDPNTYGEVYVGFQGSGYAYLPSAAPTTPVDIDHNINSVLENAGKGTPVGITVSATDHNAAPVTYGLTDDAGGRFAINGDTGVVTVAKSSLLDYETGTSYTIIIKAVDPTGVESSHSYAVAVQNVRGIEIDGTNNRDVVGSRASSNAAVGAAKVAHLQPTREEDLIKGHGGNDLLFGLAGNDVIHGGRGQDAIFGGDGEDIINAGPGKDRLFGGTGADTFVFRNTPSAENPDKLKDFTVGEDILRLSKSVFKSLGADLQADQFSHGNRAHDTSNHIMYDVKTGALAYDPDGTGDHAPVVFAILPSHLDDLSSDDFLIR